MEKPPFSGKMVAFLNIKLYFHESDFKFVFSLFTKTASNAAMKKAINISISRGIEIEFMNSSMVNNTIEFAIKSEMM